MPRTRSGPMTPFRIGVAALLLLGAGGAAAAGATTPAAARLDALLASTRTLTARFTETVSNANAATVKQSSGSVAIAKPGRFRWDYRKPYRQIIVADGTRLWVYDPGLEQVTVRPEPRALAAGPASLLAGSGSVEASFEVSDSGRSGGLEWLRLVPTSADSDYREIRIGLGLNDEIRAMELDSKLGQTTRLDFTDVKRNVAIDPGRFRFKPPKGADVVQQAPAGGSAPGP